MPLAKIIKLYGSRLAFGLIGFLLLIQFFNQAAWKQPNAIRHDMNSYYSYLPAALIHHDLALHFDQGQYGDLYSWAIPAAKGKVQRMTMGVALLELPFFLTADWIAQITDLERNPLSETYLFAVFFGSLFYHFLGLWLLFLLLQNYFSKGIATLTVLALSVGTNLYYYTFYEPLMAHNFNFFLYAALLYSNMRWHKTPRYGTALTLGLILGLLVLIRPTHILAFLVPLLYDAANAQKWQTVRANLKQVLLIGLVALAVFTLQMGYWKWLSNHWVFYSYGDEGFFWKDPKIVQGLIGARKGWLVYSPIMIAALAGIYYLRKKTSHYTLLLLTFLPVYCYVVFSWWCWWYGGSFGARPMVDILPLMALPLSATFAAINGIKRGYIMVYVGLSLFIALNLFQTKQYRSTLLHWDSMSWPLYKAIFLKKYFPPNYPELLQPPDYEKAKKGQRG